MNYKYLFLALLSLGIFAEEKKPNAREISETTFSYWDKPDIQVFYSAPPIITPKTKILFLVHGVSRTAERYLNDWVLLSQGRDVLLVAPKFSKEFYNEYAYLMKTNKTGRPMNDTTLDLDSSLDELFNFFSAKFKIQTNDFRLYGHSGGAQFVHRYLMLGKETRIDKVAIANAGFYTFADSSISFPFGIKNMNVSDDRLKWFLSLKGGLFLGDMDNDPKHKSLPSMRKAKKQGKHRFERGTNFFNDLVGLGVKKNTPFRWRYQVVPGIAHDNTGMSLAISEFLLEDL
jgi:hypothetical protein